MARSVSLHPEHKEKARLALERNGFLTQGALAANLGIALSTVHSFLNCKNVHISTYEKICEALNLDKRAILQPIAASKPISVTFSAYNPQTFTGRDAEIEQFTTLLSGSCRMLAITGMTGIGKTALAERVVANLMESPKSSTLPYIRFSLDDRSLSPDFSISGAALLRTLGEETTLADQQDAANLLAHILKRLCSNPCRLQIDSLERLLKGNEQEGWSEFCDPLWLDLLHQFVAGNDCPSQLLLTSQDITGDLDAMASRYSGFYRCQTLRGLNSDEQRDFFQKLGLLVDPDSTVIDLDYLNRIGAFYDGHPLVLQVVADEILQPPFQGNIALYWHHYEAEFSETAAPTTNKLARSRLFRRRVRQRVAQTIQRLPSPARQMLCACAVFRRPVPMGFWLAMLTDEEPQAEFDMLQDRHLVEFVSASDDTVLVRQHNLIRSVAYDLLKANASIWYQAERQAAHLWLTAYEPAPDTPKLATVCGYLEAFDHYCQVEDWEIAKDILLTPLDSFGKVHILRQLEFCSLYQEGIRVCQKILNKSALETDASCLRMLGNYYLQLSSYPKALNYYEQSLDISREIGDHRGQGATLNNLGLVYLRTGQYEQAINLFQQYLTISREIGDLGGEGPALGNLGIAYYRLGQYERAINLHRQNLTIAREIGDRWGEGITLGDMGNAYGMLGQYEQAINLFQQYLAIAREIGDRRSEGNALGSLGITYNQLGQYERAINFNQQCLTITREIGDRQGEGFALFSMGTTQLKLEQYPESLANNQAALEISCEIGDRASEAKALQQLAELHQALGEIEVARQYCQQALALATELGILLAAECQTLMKSLDREAEEAKVVQEEIS